jgi:hypothetical protein
VENHLCFFLIVEGESDGYPSYNNAKVHFEIQDPASIRYSNLFICSSLFSVNPEGSSIPPLNKNTRITFLMIPNVFDAINEIENKFYITNQLWFSLGLANIVLIDNTEGFELTASVINFLTETSKLTASESWFIDEDNKICKSQKPETKLYSSNTQVEYCNIHLSEHLPLHLKFAVSEYIISVNKLLTASKKFTPYYFNRHQKIISATSQIVNDLSFLNGDVNFEPSNSILNIFQSKNAAEAFGKINEENGLKIATEIIKEKHGALIQFNSALSYIYSQCYSGTFPLFDHVGIVRRHSLLGLGTAISALYELIIQLEESFTFLPYDELVSTPYYTDYCPNTFFDALRDPSLFNPTSWNTDTIKSNLIIKPLQTKDKTELPEGFYNRLSFFSGRLGFREYEFSATAAIQVVVEAHSLKWHIINYTHEIIHDHVRYILSQLIMLPNSARKESYEAWLDEKNELYENIIQKLKNGSSVQVTYNDYFVIVLINYTFIAESFGSLTMPSNKSVIEDLRSNADKTQGFFNQPGDTLKDSIRHYYKDITEIFVHVIDYCYIYKQQLDVYMMSIWTSWGTVVAVTNDIKQYILRSLIICSLNVDGDSNTRFKIVKIKFLQLITDLNAQKPNAVFDKILLDDECARDLMMRFYNCIIIGDLVYNFFVAKLETHLDNKDDNILPDGLYDDDIPITYYINTNTFIGQPIKSKVRFLLDQLGREVFKKRVSEPDELIEKTSAWLLLCLSSKK